jgi:hypothetical protein
MTPDERALLLATATQVAQLFKDRDDLVIGVTAALLDLYREEFAAGRQTQSIVIQRLQIQADALRGQLGEKYLMALIRTLEQGQLNEAGLLRLVPYGTA